jgi:hypothetical protein
MMDDHVFEEGDKEDKFIHNDSFYLNNFNMSL